MRRSNAGLIGGLLCTVALVAGLVIAGLLGGGGNPASAAGVSAAPAAATVDLPTTGCIPVAAHDGSGGSAGCVLASDQYAPPPMYDKLVARSGGVPVYTDGSARQQVGILAGDQLGFVPQALVGQLPALTACHGQLSQHLASPRLAAITADCTALLNADGYPASLLTGTTASFGTTSSAERTTAAN